MSTDLRREEPPLVVVVGDIALDYTIEVSESDSLDEKFKVKDSLRALGGTGANSASQVVALGGRSELVSCVGDDPTGVWLLQNAQSAGIGVTSIAKRGGQSTTSTIVLSETGRKVFVDIGVGAEISIPNLDLIESAQLIYVSYAHHLVHDLVNMGFGPRLVVGLEQWMVSDELLEACQHCLLVVTNEAGADTLDLSSQPALVLTRGAIGVELKKFGEVAVFTPAFAVEAVDTTGAGDSFAGALCFSLASGETIEKALRFSAAAAALSTLSRGSQSGLPSLEDVNALLVSQGK